MLEKFITNHIIHHLSHTPTPQQLQLIQNLSCFLTNQQEKRCFVLNGYAGTGKTTVVSALVKTMQALNQHCVLLAPTGRAAKVISKYATQRAYTIHKYIYRQNKGNDINTLSFNLGYNALQNTLFIVDEAGMISSQYNQVGFGTGNLMNDLVNFVYQGKGCSLLLLGDDAQLPPIDSIKSNALDPQFLQGFGLDVTSYKLTEVVRQEQTSTILTCATQLRTLLDQPHASHDHYTIIQDFIHQWVDTNEVKKISSQDVVNTIENAYNEVGKEETLIITRMNWQTNQYNQGIRAQILWKDEQLSNGDLIMLYRNNYGVPNEKHPDENIFLANGEIFQVVRLSNEREMYGFHFVDAILHTDCQDQEISAIIWLDTLFQSNPNLNYNLQKELYKRIAEDYPEEKSQKKLHELILKSPYYNALQVRFAYAVTCHKAQGGQWKRVFIDTTDSPNKEQNTNTIIEQIRWLYTAVTRATENVYFLVPSIQN